MTAHTHRTRASEPEIHGKSAADRRPGALPTAFRPASRRFVDPDQANALENGARVGENLDTPALTPITRHADPHGVENQDAGVRGGETEGAGD